MKKMDRLEIVILRYLLNDGSTSKYDGNTISDFMEVEKETSKLTIYRKMKHLLELGYIAKGVKDVNADTYYITKSGIDEISETEKEGNKNV